MMLFRHFDKGPPVVGCSDNIEFGGYHVSQCLKQHYVIVRQ